MNTDKQAMWTCNQCSGKYHKHPHEDVPKEQRICAKCYWLNIDNKKKAEQTTPEVCLS